MSLPAEPGPPRLATQGTTTTRTSSPDHAGMPMMRHQGWLYKKFNKGPHVKWKKLWFYLSDDRLCYLVDGSVDQPGSGRVRYISLDRIPVRPLPVRQKRVQLHQLTPPDIGVHIIPVHAHQPRETGRRRRPPSAAGNSGASRLAQQASPGTSLIEFRHQPGTVFTLVAGAHTHFLAAETEMQAKQWVAAIREAWSLCFAHSLRRNGGELTAVQASDGQQGTQHLMMENATLRGSLAQMEERLAATDSEYWRRWLEEVAKNKKLEALAVERIEYEVVVRTWIGKGAGTDSNVFVELSGTSGTSGEVQLQYEDDPDKKPFQRGSVDTFQVRCAPLGALQSVKVWQNCSGRRPRWFLEEICVRRKGAAKWVHFPCMRWLAVDRDDCRICRLLTPAAPLKTTKYSITAVTSNLRGAGTDANVFVILHGQAKESRRHLLSGGPQDFERGSSSEFLVDDMELGELLGLTIGHDNTGSSPAWHVDHVRVLHAVSGAAYLFPARCWLDANSGDGAIQRCLPVQRSMAPEVAYLITTVTSDVRGAGTDADVYIILHGSSGSSARTTLPSNPEHFERGQRDAFRLLLPDVGQLEAVTIGHNNSGPGPSWHLECVEVAVEAAAGRPPLKRVWFPCNRWLAVGQDDGLTERTLLAVDADPSASLSWYQVDFHTADERGAGTDANVWLELQGHMAGSGRLQAAAGKEAFERGRVDSFRYKLQVLGELQRLVVGHDGTGEGPEWLLDKVVVTCEKTREMVVFPASCWLTTQAGKAAVVELRPNAAPQQQAVYTLALRTSHARGAGTDAQVNVELHGAQAGQVVGPVKLEGSADCFSRGKDDIFILKGRNIGPIHKLKIWTDFSGQRPSWHLDHIVLAVDTPQPSASPPGMPTAATQWQPAQPQLQSDTRTSRLDSPRATVSGPPSPTGKPSPTGRPATLQPKSGDDLLAQPGSMVFWCRQWFDQQQGLVKELLPARPGEAPPTAKFIFKVKTSDMKGAGTDSNIDVELRGTAGTSGWKRLAANHDTFERGQEDTFELQLPDIGQPQVLAIRSDATGDQHAWHLDRVAVTCLSMQPPITLYFPASRWISREHGLVAELQGTLQEPRSVLMPYKLDITTSDIRNAGTDATIWVELVGMMGASGKQLLVSKPEHFERGQTDTFTLNLPQLGMLQALRVFTDNKGPSPAWHLDLVVATLPTGEKLYFSYNNWLDEKKPQVEIPASLQDPRGNKTVYRVSTTTSQERGAGTDAGVYIEIRGMLQSSGRMPLVNASKNCFERGATDDFEVTCSNLGELEELVVGHDSKGLSAAWHLAHVKITDVKAGRVWWFAANRWLEGKGGLPAEAVLAASAQDPTTNLSKYKVVVTTSKVKGAGTDSNVWVELRGSLSCSGRQMLRNSKLNNFERGSTDEFMLECTAVGDLEQVAVGHDGKGLGAAWHLELLTVSDLKSGRVWYCECNDWLDTNGPTGAEKLLKASTQDPASLRTTYKVVTHTSNVSGAGTDANVFIVLHGQGGDSGHHKLDSSGRNDFEKGQRDEFRVTCRDLGQLTKILIGHDNAGMGSAWHLSHVEVTSMKTGQMWLFPCRQWLSASHGDKATQRELKVAASMPVDVTWLVKVITSDVSGAGTDANVYIQLHGAEGESAALKLDNSANNFERGKTDEFRVVAPEVGDLKRLKIWHDGSGAGAAWHLDSLTVTNTAAGTTWYFFCGQWLDPGNGLERMLPACTTDQRPPSHLYRVTTHTSDVKSAGTDANVFVDITGAAGNSGPQALRTKGNANPFEKGKADAFELLLPLHLGDLQQLAVWHDGKGLGAGWHLDFVEVADVRANKVWYFVCREWLDAGQGDRATRRVLQASARDPRASKAQYRVVVTTSDIRGAGTDANVFIVIRGTDGDTGRKALDNPGRNDFERGQEDTFMLEAADVGSLTGILIGHDGKGLGAGWHLARVVVEHLGRGQRAVFTVGQWFDTGVGDKRIERELVPDGGAVTGGGGESVVWTVVVVTGDVRGAGTDADVFLAMRGEKGASNPQLLRAKPDAFERGCRDKFEVTTGPLGRLLELTMSHNNKGPGPAWYLEAVEVSCQATGEYYFFPFNRWLDEKTGTSATATPQAKPAPSAAAGPPVAYRFDFTPEPQGSPHPLPPSILQVNLIGATAHTGLIPLTPAPAPLPTAHPFSHTLPSAPNVGAFQQLQVMYQTQGPAPSWALRDVLVTNEATRATGRFIFQRAIPPATPVAAPLFQPAATDYLVQVQTGDVWGAGTDANVFVAVFGADGTTGRQPLRKAARNCFERNQLDEFRLQGLPDVGRMRELEIGHDGSGPGAGWHLVWVRVTNVRSGERRLFPCNRWLDRKEGDGRIVLLLQPEPDGKVVLLSAAVEQEQHGDRIAAVRSGMGEQLSGSCSMSMLLLSPTARSTSMVGEPGYKVTIHTSNIARAGTNGGVFFELIGRHGSSGVVRPPVEAGKEQFGRGMSATMVYPKMPYVGELLQLRLGCDGKGLFPAWHVRVAEVEHLATGVRWSFACHAWVDGKCGWQRVLSAL